jgi:hypothetical protein
MLSRRAVNLAIQAKDAEPSTHTAALHRASGRSGYEQLILSRSAWCRPLYQGVCMRTLKDKLTRDDFMAGAIVAMIVGLTFAVMIADPMGCLAGLAAGGVGPLKA